ncbi:MAG: hypothetical protein ACRCZG_01365 [Culicoidibacterales bacterium]
MTKRITITINEKDIQEVQKFVQETTKPTYDIKNAIELLELVRTHYHVSDSREAIFYIRALLQGQLLHQEQVVPEQQTEQQKVTTVNHHKLLNSTR